MFRKVGVHIALVIACAVSADAAWADKRELGWQISTYRYEEPGFVQLSGTRGGLSGAYDFERERVFHRPDVRMSYGQLRYEGSGVMEGVPDFLVETRWVIGMHLGDEVRASPYAGLGYRFLFDDIRGITWVGNKSYAGYRRYSNYLYAPIGTTLTAGLGSGWRLAVTMEYDHLIRGWQVSKLSDVGLGDPDVTNVQRRGRGDRWSLMLQDRNWSFGPWLQRWNIERSEHRQNWFEPANRTREVGMEIRRRF